MRVIPIGILGLGNVGAGVVRLLRQNAEPIEQRLGARLEVRRVAVRDEGKPRLVDLPPGVVTGDVEAVLADPELRILVELIGGVDHAARYVLRAIDRGMHVVTANKALLAERGDELFAAAAARGVHVFYEASVCGGVPVLRALREGLASDRVRELYGIVNGTCNYILSTMSDSRRPFAEVLAEAQAQGFAEADPALDVDGIDAAHKLTLLTALAFGARTRLGDVHVEGIRAVEPVDIAYADRFGCVIKLLARAREREDGALEAMVAPTLVPRRFLLAGVGGVFNAVYVVSEALGASMYYGRGAGMMPTAVAVVSDLIDVGRDLAAGAGSLRRPRPLAARRFAAPGEHRARYYLRFAAPDRPGVLAQLAGALGERGVSIAEVVQERHAEGDGAGRPVHVVMLTHEALERDVRAALERIAAHGSAAGPPRVFRIAG